MFAMVIEVLTIIISSVAFILSLLSFFYNRNKNKIERAIELANVYRKLINDISEFNKIFEEHSEIQALLAKEKLDEKTRFNYSEIMNIYSSKEKQKIENFFFGNGMNADILRKVYFTYRLQGVSDINPMLLNSSKKTDEKQQAVQDSLIRNYYKSKFCSFLNQMEFFSMAFVQNVADDDVVYQSLHQTFLGITRYFYYYISRNNKSTENKYYTNIIQLHSKWIAKQMKYKNKADDVIKHRKKC